MIQYAHKISFNWWNMSLDTKHQSLYFHINTSVDIKTIDVGYAMNTKWDITENYPYYCLNFLLSGETLLEIEDKQFTVLPNQCFLIPPNTPVHYYTKENNTKVEVYWINFYGKDCEELIAMTNFSKSPVLQLPVHARSQILSNFKETLKLCNYSHVQGIICNQLLSTIIKSILLNSKLFIETAPRKKLTDFDKIIALINSHLFSPNLNAAFICKQCYITPEHLSRLFKKNMNLHFSSYVNTERIKKASALLLDTDYPLVKIAELVGYGDVYYFCKIFKKYRLMTPSEYRKSHALTT